MDNRDQIQSKVVKYHKRYLGGVCLKLSNTYDVEPLIMRALFIIGAILFQLPVIFYIVLWVFYAQKFSKVLNKRKRNQYQFMGWLLGTALGAVFGYLLPSLVYGEGYSSYAELFYGFVGFLVGGLIGFILGRRVLENSENNLREKKYEIYE